MLWILAACAVTAPPPDPRHFALPWRGAPLPSPAALDLDAVTWTVVPEDAAFVKDGWLHGHLASSRVRRSSYGDARRDACLHAGLATATFPAAAYGSEVEYTFTLTPR